MTNVIIENLVQIAATLLITLIGVLGAWLSTKLAKREELKNISTATNEVIHATRRPARVAAASPHVAAAIVRGGAA